MMHIFIGLFWSLIRYRIFYHTFNFVLPRCWICQLQQFSMDYNYKLSTFCFIEELYPWFSHKTSCLSAFTTVADVIKIKIWWFWKCIKLAIELYIKHNEHHSGSRDSQIGIKIFCLRRLFIADEIRWNVKNIFTNGWILLGLGFYHFLHFLATYMPSIINYH